MRFSPALFYIESSLPNTDVYHSCRGILSSILEHDFGCRDPDLSRAIALGGIRAGQDTRRAGGGARETLSRGPGGGALQGAGRCRPLVCCGLEVSAGSRRILCKALPLGVPEKRFIIWRTACCSQPQPTG